jgi:hypothetical protein
MNYNPSPKSEFVKEPQRVKRHHELVEQESLRVALITALLEYQRIQTKLSAPDLGGCAACFLRLQGAQEFVELLLNLAETSAPSAMTDSVNLPGNIRQFPTANPTTKKG